MTKCRNCAILLLCLLLLTACAADGPDAQEPLTLDWYVNFSWFTSTWGDNLVARTITQRTGVSINFITPAGNEWEKLNSMLTSGSLPDLITLGHWESQFDQIVEAGQAFALNELADQYDPYFWEVAHPQRVAWYTKEDGNLYGYPNSSYAPSDYESHGNIGANQAFLVRKDIYEAIGSPDMTTPEGFVQALRDAAEQFPLVEGQPLIPVGLYAFEKDGCFSLEDILMNLLAVPFERDGRKVDRYTDPDYIEWLKVFRGLTQEGFLPDDVFVDRRVQTTEKVAQGRYFCLLYQHTDIADQQIRLYADHPGSQYIAVDGPKNRAGDDHVLPGVGINGWTVTLISKNCKNPERAIKLLSFLMSEEGQLLTYCGVEGETYDLVDGLPVVRPEVLELLSEDRLAYNSLYGADNTYWMLQDLVMQLDWKPPARPPLAQPQEWTYPYTVYAAQYEPTFIPSTAAGNAHYRIRDEWGSVLPALLMAESDQAFDALLESYLIRRDELGHDLVVQEAERQMRAVKERLQILN